MGKLQTRNLSIMFTDMKGFTTKTATQSREQLQHLLEMQDQLIRPAIAQFDGEIVKTIGDAFMVSFDSPTDAVLCGMKIQENVLNHNARATSSDQFEVRIAVNSGEVNIKDGDVFGEPVNIASRIESIAEPNEVYFTESIYLSMNKNEIPSAEVGHRRLKGIPEEIKVYKVLSEQTNLIRAKLKRQQEADAAGMLSKDEVHEPGVPDKGVLIEERDKVEEKKKFALPTFKKSQEKKEGSFWQRHKKKIIWGIIIFIILNILGNIDQKNKELEKAEENLRLRQELIEIRDGFEAAAQSGDSEAISELYDTILEITERTTLPDDVVEGLREWAAKQKDERRTPDQKEQIRQMIKNLDEQ